MTMTNLDPAASLVVEVGGKHPSFFNGRYWARVRNLDTDDKQLLASIAGMTPDTERPTPSHDTVRVSFGTVGGRRVALLHQKADKDRKDTPLADLLKCSGIPDPLCQLWQALQPYQPSEAL